MCGQKLDDLFWELKSCKSDRERETRLSDLRRADPQLAAHLAQLLEADANLGGFMQLNNAPDATVVSEANDADLTDVV